MTKKRKYWWYTPLFILLTMGVLLWGFPMFIEGVVEQSLDDIYFVEKTKVLCKWNEDAKLIKNVEHLGSEYRFGIRCIDRIERTISCHLWNEDFHTYDAIDCEVIR